MEAMKTIEEIRRDWIEVLIAQYGSIANLNEALGRDRTDATFSQLRNQSANSTTGTPRSMGSELARNTERALNLEIGSLDHPPPTLVSRGPILMGEPSATNYQDNVVRLPAESPLRRELLNLLDQMNDRGIVLLIDQAEQIAARHPKVQANPAR